MNYLNNNSKHKHNVKELEKAVVNLINLLKLLLKKIN